MCGVVVRWEIPLIESLQDLGILHRLKYHNISAINCYSPLIKISRYFGNKLYIGKKYPGTDILVIYREFL